MAPNILDPTPHGPLRIVIIGPCKLLVVPQSILILSILCQILLKMTFIKFKYKIETIIKGMLFIEFRLVEGSTCYA